MDRRTFVSSLSLVPFIPSLNWADKDYYSLYFGGFASGKTTRLVNDAIQWLQKNPGMRGVYLTNSFPQIKNIRVNILEQNWPKHGEYDVRERTLSFHGANDSSLLFISAGCQGMLGQPYILDGDYHGLWVDQVNVPILSVNKFVIKQQVISMDSAISFHNKYPSVPRHKISDRLFGVKHSDVFFKG